MRINDLNEFGPDERYTKIGNTTVIGNKKTGSVSAHQKIGNTTRSVNNNMNSDGSQGNVSAKTTIGGNKFTVKGQVNNKNVSGTMNNKPIKREGWSRLPDVDRDKYQSRDGLEGPIMTKSGKVVYYDPKEGKYYDPDTDIYLSYDEWKQLDEGDMEADEKNPYAQPYMDEPEWKILHDMDDDIIQAYVKHKKFRGRVTRMPTESEFKPHMMYDPKTGKGKMAKKEADHLKMKEKGWGHDKVVKELNELDTVNKVKKAVSPEQSALIKQKMKQNAQAISSVPGGAQTVTSRTNMTKNSSTATGTPTSNKHFSKFVSKSGDRGGSSLTKTSHTTSTPAGSTTSSTKRYVRPGGSGTNTTSDGAGNVTRTNFQLKGPQTWMYDKPKTKANAIVNSSKNTKESNTISTRQNFNTSDKGGVQKSNYTSHSRDFDSKKGLSTLTTAQQQDGSTSSRFVMPGGSGVATKNGVEKKIQMKGPQSWAYDKPKLNASKKIKEDGVIVPGVNTTVDVKPGQTEKEAAKFGNGKIKPLMPKGKSNSHILFNLGLAESLIDKKLKEVDKDGDGNDDLAGFDAKTTYALKALQAKYPHADNLMSAMMAQTEQTLQNQNNGDLKRDEQDKKHNDRFHELEKKLINIIKKNELKEGKKGI